MVAPGDWRWRRGWSEEELRDAFVRIGALPPNFDVPADQMRQELGWNHVESQAIVGREPPGPPVPGGGFERARRSMEALRFSDPRIVVNHYAKDSELDGRLVLLELRSLGFSFLCPVRVVHVQESSVGEETSFRFSYETLEGHIERGREWFILSKDHRTGELRFRVEAEWRAGDFPGIWAWAGFQLLGRRYQRAWHRLAHKRMRAIVAGGVGALDESITQAPVHFLGTRGVGAWSASVEVELEKLRAERLAIVAALGALAGLRTFLPLALVSRVCAGAATHVLLDERATGILTLASVAELVGDKLPSTPNRTSAPALLGRAVAGAAVGHMLSRIGGRTRTVEAVIAAMGAAVLSTFASFRLRRALSRRVGEPLAGVVEDVLALGAGVLLTARLRSRQTAQIG